MRKTPNGHVPLAELSEGDFFGLLPFVDIGHEPYSASVFADKERLKVNPVDVSALQGEYDRMSSTLKHMLENMATCISATSAVACGYLQKAAKKQKTN